MTLSDSKGGFRGAGGEAKADQDLSRGGSLVARGVSRGILPQKILKFLVLGNAISARLGRTWERTDSFCCQ